MFEFIGPTAIVLQETSNMFVIHGGAKVLLLAAAVEADAKIGDVVELCLNSLFALRINHAERTQPA